MSTHTTNYCSPLYSSVPKTIVEDVVQDAKFSEDVVPKVVQALDELQVGLLNGRVEIPDGVWERAHHSSYLQVEEYPGVHGDKYSHLLFLSGEIAQSYLSDALPAQITDCEEQAVRIALKRYAKQPGFNFMFDPVVTPIPTRTIPHDELVMDEPGSFMPPVA